VPHRQEGIACAILAGGRSSRYGGFPKGNLRRPDGRTLLGHLADEVRACGIREIVLVANDRGAYADAGLEIVSDLRCGLGPLAGIETALARFPGRDGVLLLACDLACLTRHEIAALLEAFERNGRRLVAARTTSSFWHPLCSVVHNGLRGAVQAALDAGRLSVHRLWEEAGALPVEFSDEAPFANVNSPADWDALRSGQGSTGVRRICAPAPWREALEKWSRQEGVPLELGGEGEAGVRVEEPGGRQPSDLETLRIHGWIPCELGPRMARQIGVPERKLAGFLNVLDIRVRKCRLGCF